MILRVPDYYQEFRCIADRCKDNCCIGWEIDIDEDTYDYYRQVEGKLGERLRKYMKDGEAVHFELQQKRCPFLNKQNLCDICSELGEEALCEVCTEYPRFTMEYGNVREKTLALSCEEAGRLLFTHKEPVTFEEAYTGQDDLSQEDDISPKKIETVVAARDFAIHLLQDRTYPLKQRMMNFLAFSEQIQNCLNHNELLKIDDCIAKFHHMKEVKEAKACNSKQAHLYFGERMDILAQMEILDDEWHDYLRAMRKQFGPASKVSEYQKALHELSVKLKDREYEYENLIVYFVFRYLIRSLYDDNFLDRAKAAVFYYLVIRDMDALRLVQNQGDYTVEDRIDVARIFSKEVEHSEDNLEYLEEAMLFEHACEMDSLYAQIAMEQKEKKEEQIAG